MEYIVGVPSVLIFLLSFCLFILELFLGFCNVLLSSCSDARVFLSTVLGIRSTQKLIIQPNDERCHSGISSVIVYTSQATTIGDPRMKVSAYGYGQKRCKKGGRVEKMRIERWVYHADSVRRFAMPNK
ncbi:hypothetical protein KCU85_g398, partial [Aureobasidium melanogenum]